MTKNTLQLFKRINTVKLLPDLPMGSDIYYTGDLTPHRKYDVYGIDYRPYSNDEKLCYLIKNDIGVLRFKVVKHFEVIN